MTSENLLNQLVELTGNASNAFTIALYKVNPDKDVLVLRHHVSLSANFDSDIKIEFGEGPIGMVAQTKQPYLEENLEQKPINLCIYKKKEDLKSLLILPAIHKKLEGVIIIDSKESYSFSVKQQKIITGLVNQMSWHLNREKKLSLDEEPSEDIFRDLISYCRFIAESPDKVKAIDSLINVPASILRCDACAVILFDSSEAGKIFKYRGFNKNAANISIHLGKGLVGSCAKNQCPVILRNTSGRNTVIFGVDEKKEGFLSLIAAPIAFSNQLYGVVVCGSNNAESFSNFDLNRLTLMACSTASAIFCTKTKEKWNYNKNLDQITGIPNHRFLAEHGVALEKEVLKNGTPVCFLSLHLSNLAEFYMSFGIEYGDQIQRGIASTLSKTLPSPKYIFKFSDTIYVVFLIDQQSSNALLLKERLEQAFKKTPFFIDGRAVKLHTSLGVSCFPEDGRTLSQLIGASLSKITSKTNFETIIPS